MHARREGQARKNSRNWPNLERAKIHKIKNLLCMHVRGEIMYEKFNKILMIYIDKQVGGAVRN